MARDPSALVYSNQRNPVGKYGRASGGDSKTGKPMTTNPDEYVTSKGADKRTAKMHSVPESAMRDGDEVDPAYDWWPQPTGDTRSGAVSLSNGSARTEGNTFPGIGSKPMTKEITTPHEPKPALRNGKKPQGLRNKPTGPLP